MDTTEVKLMKTRAFTVKAHWGLLIRSGLMTCENRSFRVPPGFYLVHASGSLSFSDAWRLLLRRIRLSSSD